MSRIAVVMTIALCFLAVNSACPVLAADQKAPVVAAKPAAQAPAGGKAMPKPNFNMLTGTITRIDSSDPANVKIEVKNEADNSMHTVSVMPYTNISKVTDVKELKTGEMVRVMSRKMDDKDVAMGILFGNIKAAPKAPPMPRPAAQAAKPVAAAKK